MSIRMLRTLVAVADHRTFSAAAETVFVTHAAVSQQMRALEAQLNLEIFDRSSRTPMLTPVGHALVAKARVLIADYDSLATSFSNESSIGGEITLGVVPTSLVGLLPRAMAKLRNLSPNLRVRIHPGSTTELLADLDRGVLDVALITKPKLISRSLVYQEVANEPLCLIASPELAEIGCDELLRTQPFIRFNRTAVVGQLIESWIQEHGYTVNEVMELDNLDAISSMVYMKLGVSITPKPCVPPYRTPPLASLSLGKSAPMRSIGLAYRANNAKELLIKEIYQTLEQAVQQAKLNSDPEDRT